MTDLDDIPTNPATAPSLTQLVSRRAMLFGLGGAMMAGMMKPAWALASDGLFVPLAPGLDDQLSVAPGYRAQTLLRFGQPIFANAPAFDPKDRTAADQAQQFGAGNDFIAFFPLPLGTNNSDHGLLVVNHEYPDSHLIFAGVDKNTYPNGMNALRVAAEQAALGVSIVEIRRHGDEWQLVLKSDFNRRITGQTPMGISGPAAGHHRMKTPDDPDGRTVLGTIGNCAGGVTPWGTYLTCEENINMYFGGVLSEQGATEQENHRRMGVGPVKIYAAWSVHDRRFNLAYAACEANRFGWVVEIDPFSPNAVPVKRTALGRFKHESATVAVAADNRVVVYSGDDQAFEFLYKFVSSKPYDPKDRLANRDLLDDGMLYVAQFSADGALRRLPLMHGIGPLTAENGFTDQADVMIEARRAGTLLQATPLDRPEDIAIHPQTGGVYVALSKNAARTAEQIDAVNPRAKNLAGHIVEITPAGGDHGAVTAAWNIFMLAGEKAHRTDGLANPDNLTFDPDGRLWIATDGAEDVTGYADGVFLSVNDSSRPGSDEHHELRQLLRVPMGAEATGPCFTPDGRTLFVSIQHPAENAASQQMALNLFPDYDPVLPARSSVVAIRHHAGKKIGEE